jgi:hypothetical protein
MKFRGEGGRGGGEKAELERRKREVRKKINQKMAFCKGGERKEKKKR